MSDNVTKNSPGKFVSYDEADENGVRAEIVVQKNKGGIKEIKTEKADKGFVDVHFDVAGLNFAVHGWVSVNSPVYKLVETARDNNEEVEFRIETQRKSGIDPEIPMKELRKDTTTALKSVRTVLVGINGVYTDELMTNPAEDAIILGGRQPAKTVGGTVKGNGGGSSVSIETRIENLRKIVTEGGVRASVLDSMVAVLLLDGAPAELVHQIVGGDKRDTSQPALQSSFSVEAPSWKDYNSDGRMNLGSGAVAAAVGIETLLAEQFRELVQNSGYQAVDNIDDAVTYYLDILLAICDRVQTFTYGAGFRADRAASSHTRIRGIMYELIKKEIPLPVDLIATENGGGTIRYNEEKHVAWVKFLGNTGIKRFRRSVEAALAYPDFKAPVPAKLLGEAPVSAPVQTVEQTPAPEPEQAPEPVSEASLPTSEPEPPVDEPAPVAEPTAEPETHVLVQAPNVDTVVDTSTFYEMVPLEAEQVEGEEKADDDSIRNLARVFEGSGFNLKDPADKSRVSELLAATFGPEYANPRNLPKDLLDDFSDHYENMGTQVLHAAIAYAHEQTSVSGA